MISKEIESIYTLQHEKMVGNDIRSSGRILAKHVNYKNIGTPSVTLYKKQQGEYNPVWPHNKKAAIVLTHDVDSTTLSLKQRMRHLFYSIKNRDAQAVINGCLGVFNSSKDPDWQFEHILSLEKKYNARSTFYFMATEDHDKRYDISSCADTISYLEQEGWEVGLHGGMESYNDAAVLLEEKRRLEQYTKQPVVGIRQHFLRLDPQCTWKFQHEAGFMYDTTLGYSDALGFRSGAAHLYPVYTGEDGKTITEIPLAVMDTTIDSYLHYSFDTDAEDVWKMIQEVIDSIIAVGGCAAFLWHTNRFNSVLYPGASAIYERLLRYCTEQGVWLTSAKEAYTAYTNEH